MKHIASALAILAFCISLPSCGGGGGAEAGDGSPATVRPKTMDGIVLTLSTNVRFQFVRSLSSPPALLSGDVETGTFIYGNAGVNRRQFPNTNGDNSDTQFPDSVTSANYSYRAINESSGVLTLTAVGVNDLIVTGSYNALNGSFVELFNSDSFLVDNFTVVIDLTFAANLTTATITSNTATVSQPGGNPLYDIILVPSGVSLVGGAPVPTNYNPTLDPLRESLIAAATLNNRVFVFEHGLGNPALDFRIQFVADAGLSTVNNEIGQGLLRVAGSVVDNAVDYTYTRTAGTDDAVLVISNASNTFDGRYTLEYAGTDNGEYIGEVDAGTLDAADVSGQFFIPGFIP